MNKNTQATISGSARVRWIRSAFVGTMVVALMLLGAQAAFAATVNVTALEPSWTAVGGGGVGRVPPCGVSRAAA